MLDAHGPAVDRRLRLRGGGRERPCARAGRRRAARFARARRRRAARGRRRGRGARAARRSPKRCRCCSRSRSRPRPGTRCAATTGCSTTSATARPTRSAPSTSSSSRSRASALRSLLTLVVPARRDLPAAAAGRRVPPDADTPRGTPRLGWLVLALLVVGRHVPGGRALAVGRGARPAGVRAHVRHPAREQLRQQDHARGPRRHGRERALPRAQRRHEGRRGRRGRAQRHGRLRRARRRARRSAATLLGHTGLPHVHLPSGWVLLVVVAVRVVAGRGRARDVVRPQAHPPADRTDGPRPPRRRSAGRPRRRRCSAARSSCSPRTSSPSGSRSRPSTPTRRGST